VTVKSIPAVLKSAVTGFPGEVVATFGAPDESVDKRTHRHKLICAVSLAALLGTVAFMKGQNIWITPVTFVLLILPWYLARRMPPQSWYPLLVRSSLALALVLIGLFAISLGRAPDFSFDELVNLADARPRLSLSSESGLAYYAGFCVAIAYLLFTSTLCFHAENTTSDHHKLFGSTVSNAGASASSVTFKSLQSALDDPIQAVARFCAAGGGILIAIELWHLHEHGTRLTLFGTVADFASLFALIVMTLLGLALLASVIGRSFGILSLCRLILTSVNARRASPASAAAAKLDEIRASSTATDGSSGALTPDITHQLVTVRIALAQKEVISGNTNYTITTNATEEKVVLNALAPEAPKPAKKSGSETAATDEASPLAFPATLPTRPEFLITPMLAFPWAGGPAIVQIGRNIVSHSQDLEPLVNPQIPLTPTTLFTLFALLVREIGLVQNAILGVALTALTATLLVFLSPVSDGDGLLLVNLSVLAATGLFSGYMTMRFETDEVLSRVLCDRGKKAEFSVAIFGYVAFPFTVLAIAIAIADIPGVLSWGNGIVETLLQFTRPSILK
jgi:hypothetical protein